MRKLIMPKWSKMMKDTQLFTATEVATLFGYKSYSTALVEGGYLPEPDIGRIGRGGPNTRPRWSAGYLRAIEAGEYGAADIKEKEEEVAKAVKPKPAKTKKPARTSADRKASLLDSKISGAIVVANKAYDLALENSNRIESEINKRDTSAEIVETLQSTGSDHLIIWITLSAISGGLAALVLRGLF